MKVSPVGKQCIRKWTNHQVTRPTDEKAWSPGCCNGNMPQYREKGQHLVQLSKWTTATGKGHQLAWRTLPEAIAWTLALALPKLGTL